MTTHRQHRPVEDGEQSGRVSQNAPESKSQSAMVWRGLEATPGFSDELRRAEADLKAGKGTPFREIRRER